MKRLWIFSFLLLASIWTAAGLYAQAVSFPASELLGRPTANSVTVNVMADSAIEAYFQYGLVSGAYTGQTPTISGEANKPIETVIGGLESDKQYYYRMVYRKVGDPSWTNRDEHSFRTQRAPGGTFVFTITSDSHLGQYGGQTADEKALHQQTLLNAGADKPDFHLDLGDTFAMDPSPLGTGMTEAEANAAYLIERPFMGLISGSVPILLAIGNHENEEGWNFDDVFTPPDQSLARVGLKYRKLYFPNPISDGFYSANTDPLPEAIGGDTNREDYYAWQWGDALFVVLDPYQYSMVWPSEGNSYGGEGQDGEVSGNRWDWTLGIKQYLWLKDTLENSKAKYKFVFSHQVTGGATIYGRGGVSAAPYFEWGGRNADGTWGWDLHRPASEGWTVPIHQLMVANGVNAYIHGHDHIYAAEELDGITYLEVPKPDDAGYAWQPYGYGYNENLYPGAFVLQNSGHIRVTVAPSGVTLDYVRAYLPGDGTNGVVAHTVTIPAGSGGNPPAAPSSLAATAASSAQINLSWQDHSSNESGFKIERKTGSGGTYAPIATAAANETSYSDAGLASGATYFYRIRATNADGNSAYSNEASATTSGSTAQPAAPSNLVATAVSSTQIDITWQDNSGNETSFLVERITAADTDYQYASVAAGSVSYSFTGLAPATAYLFRVSAFNAAGSSDYSNIASATTSAAVPAAPSNLAATAASATQVKLSWKDNSNNESGFKIERKTGTGGTYSQIATAAANATAYSDTGVSAGTTYYYRVRAYNANGNSAYSNEASATTPNPTTPPAAPSNLNAAAVSASQINLSWQDNSSDESGFKIERKTGAGGTYSQIATAAANATAYSDGSAASGTTYYYRVAAYNAGGNSAYSNEAQATTQSSPGGNLALNQTATADNQQTANPAKNGNDGSASTRWSANNYQANHWWKVDLGASYALTGTKVKFQYARNYKYKIEVSEDGSSWTVVADRTTTTSTAQTRQDSFGATGRYVRITYTRLPTYPYTMASHFEFEVYGN
jgi:transcriptional regulator CtsR